MPGLPQNIQERVHALTARARTHGGEELQVLHLRQVLQHSREPQVPHEGPPVPVWMRDMCQTPRKLLGFHVSGYSLYCMRCQGFMQ